MADSVSYLSEPATSGKLVLHTTIGDLDIELFSHQTPLTCRTFLSLALRHAYNGCTFHRVERDFLAQTGDLSSSSLPISRLQRVRAAEWYTTPLKPEPHSRLRFNRRGLLGLARSTTPLSAAVEDNSQFFITLAAVPELTGAHTLFGKVTGDTLYNLTRLNDGDIAAPNSAVQVRITGVELLSCPWPELVTEVEEEEREWRMREEEEERRRKKREEGSNRLLKRNVNALSFGVDEVEEVAEEREKRQADRRKKGKGLHDVLQDDSKLASDHERGDMPKEAERPRLPSTSRLTAEQRPSANLTSEGEEEEEEEEDDKYDRRMRERVLRDKSTAADNTPSTFSSTTPATIKQQIQRLTKQLFPPASATPPTSDSTTADTPVVSVLEQRKQRFMQRKRQRADDSTSTDTMAKLARFRTALQLTQPTHTAAAVDSLARDGEERKAAEMDWVTASVSLLRDAEDDEERRIREQERAEGMGWMRHRLQFGRRPQDYAEEEGREDGLVVFDPMGKEGSKEEVGMGKKGLGVESNDGRRGGSRERERRRDDRSGRPRERRDRR